MLSTELTPHDITGIKTTGGTSEEALNLSLDGAAPAAEIAVPAGEVLIVSDFLGGAAEDCDYRLQVSNENGTSFMDFLLMKVSKTEGQNVVGLESPVRITGSANKKIRARVQTGVAPGEVTATVRSFSQP
jgi:hypothetical protein